MIVIEGTVYQDSTEVENATVAIFDQTTEENIDITTTDVNGEYYLEIDSEEAHLIAHYDDGAEEYNHNTIPYLSEEGTYFIDFDLSPYTIPENNNVDFTLDTFQVPEPNQVKRQAITTVSPIEAVAQQNSEVNRSAITHIKRLETSAELVMDGGLTSVDSSRINRKLIKPRILK